MRKLRVCFYMIIAAALSFTACSPPEKPHKNPPVPVTTAMAVRKTVPVQMNAIGAVEAYQSVTLKSQITGTIRKILFTEGQDVRTGELLVELDCRSNEAALKQSQANLARDRAQMRYAEEQMRRYADLVKKDYVAREQYDQVRANFESLSATVKANEALVESNRIQAQFCSIYAPIEGRIGKILVDEGNIITASTTEIAVINQIQPVSVMFGIPEKSLPEIVKHLAQERLKIDALIPGEETPERGDLTFVDNAIDKQTGMITLKGTFANRQKRLWPGQYVDVVMTLATEPGAVLVPSQSIEQGPEGQYVFVVKKDMTVEMRPVVPGRVLRDETVISKGIQAGEQVVTDGQLRLTPGAKVSIKKAK